MSFADDLTSVQSDPQAPPPGSFAADLLRAAEKRSTTSLPPLPPLGAVVPPEFGASPAAPAPASSASASPYQPLIDKYAAEYGVPADLIASVIVQESFGNPKAVSPKKAKGLMQLADGTAAMYGVTDPFDPEQNIKAGTAYLKSMLDRYGDENTALAAYNAGPTAVDDHGGIPPYPATQKYVKQVQAGRGGPKGEAGVTPPAPVSGVSPTPAPAPVQMSGVTDPASVRVTEPPYQGETPDLSTGIVTKAGVIQPVPRGQHPLDPLAAGVVAGVPQIGRGVTGGVKAAMAGDPKMAATALSDLAEGSMRVGAPLLVTALVANPLVTVPMVALATVASEQAESFAKKAGWAPEYQRLAGNAAAVAVLGLGARRIVKGIKGVEALAGDVGTQIGTKVAASRAKAEVGKPPALDPFTIDVKPGRPPVDPAGEALIRDIPPTRPMPQAQAAPVEPPVVAPPAMPPAEVVPPVAAQAPPMAREAALPVTAAPGTWPPTPPESPKSPVFSKVIRTEPPASISTPPPVSSAPPAPAEALPPPVSATPVPPAVARPPATKKRAQVSQVGAVIDDLGWQDTAQMVEMLGMDWELGDNGKVYWRGVSDSARSSGSAGPRYPASDADFLSALRDYTPGEPAVDALVARARTVVSQPVPPATTPPVASPEVPRLTYDEFAAQYRDAFAKSMKYKPSEVGSQIFTEKMAKLADEYPEYLDQLERIEEAAPKPPAPAIPGASALRMRDRLAEKKAASQAAFEAKKQGEPDAVQEPSDAILDARQQARDGRAVGKGDAEGQAPRAREEDPPEAQGEVATDKAKIDLPAIPDIPWQGPRAGSPELASLTVRHRTLTERDQRLRDQEYEVSDKVKKTKHGSKIRTSLQARLERIQAERNTYAEEYGALSKTGYDAKLQVALADPATPPEVRLAVAETILTRRKEPRLNAYDALKAEAERRLLDVGASPEEAQAEAARLASRLIESPLYEKAGFDAGVANAKQLFIERRALKADLDAYDALEETYGKSRGYTNWREKLKGTTQAGRKQYLAEAEAQLREEQESADKQAKASAERQAQEDHELANDAQVWAAKGQLVYLRLRGEAGKTDRWQAAKGERIEIPEMPEYRFWLSRDGGQWSLTEEQSGLSALVGPDKAEVLTEGVARILKNKDRLASTVAKEMENAPPKPELQNYDKPTKARKVLKAEPARPATAPAPDAILVETPEEAAAIVKEEIKHVIDTKGLANAKAIQEKVLATLRSELAGAEKFQAALALGRSIHSESITKARQGVGDKQPGENYQDHAARVRKAEDAVERPSFLDAKGVITIEVPGDGTFAIERDPKAVHAVIKRISAVGAKAWQGLGAAPLSKREASEAKFDQRKAEAEYNKRNADLTPKAKKVKTPPKSDKQARGVTIGHSLQDLARLGERV